MPRCLILTTKTSYRTEAFLAAARRVKTEIVLGSDRCHQLADAWSEEALAAIAGDGVSRSLALEYRQPALAAEQIAAAAQKQPLDAIVPTDDATAVIAALASARLGLRGNAPDAAQAARDKSVMRARLRAAGVAAPAYRVFAELERPAKVARAVREGLGFPVVAKPLLLSASRGVLRADDEAGLERALAIISAILRTRAEYADGVEAARQVLVEAFVPGLEVALEGLLAGGRLTTLALFDKPDPLDGPLFEESLYVTPSRHPPAVVGAVEATAAAAAAALGLREGPIHAELRLPLRGGVVVPEVVEVAARSIGGLCARTLRFALGGPDGGDHALEELVLRQALGAAAPGGARSGGASGVLMLPVPAAGVLQAVHGVEQARAVPLVEDVVITAAVGERMVPLPHGSSYPGFVFARATAGEGPAEVEAALRTAGARLRFEVLPAL